MSTTKTDSDFDDGTNPPDVVAFDAARADKPDGKAFAKAWLEANPNGDCSCERAGKTTHSPECLYHQSTKVECADKPTGYAKALQAERVKVQEADSDNYHPVKFALNRAVFHKELTSTEADNGIAEYEALLVVAAVADMTETGNCNPVLEKALETLAAVRAGKAVVK